MLLSNLFRGLTSAPTHRPRRSRSARPGIERCEAVVLLSGATINTQWFAKNLKDPAVESQALSAWTQDRKTLGRGDLIGILRGVASDGEVSSTELADLKTLVKNAAGLKMPDSVRVLADKTVNGNIANMTFQGKPLLATPAITAGATGPALNSLVDKWFLGADRPDLGHLATAEGGNVTYVAAAGPLYGIGKTPRPTDVAQGDLADCYFLSSMGAVAQGAPQRIKSMIADNGDGTFTVRFFNGKQADYVTVDRMLPTDTKGLLVAAGYGSAASDPGNVLWVSLVEKAYAQLSEQGYSRSYSTAVLKTTNSYDSLPYGSGAISLQQITGLPSTVTPVSDVGADPKAAAALEKKLSDAVLRNRLVLASTPRSDIDPELAEGHVYNVTGFDPRAHMVTMTNPYADGGTKLARGARLVTYSIADFSRNFNGFASVTADTRGTAIGKPSKGPKGA